MDLSSIADAARESFDRKMSAREQALVAARSSIRHSANSIRATHRGEVDSANRLMGESRAALDRGWEAVGADHPDVFFAGFLQDAQKEYAEARLTAALVAGAELPGPEDLDVGLAPYLNGIAEAIGEGRRAVLDLLRHGDVQQGERILTAMDDMHYVLLTMDYPDAITGSLRRSTDIARSLIEKTRGDLSTALVQHDLRKALEGHAERLGDG